MLLGVDGRGNKAVGVAGMFEFCCFPGWKGEGFDGESGSEVGVEVGVMSIASPSERAGSDSQL